MRAGMLGLAIVLLVLSCAQAQFFDATDLHAFCKDKHPMVAGYVAGVLDRRSRDLHHAEMSDAIDAENRRPESKRPVTDKIRANICDPDTVPLKDHIETVCAFVDTNPKERNRSADMLVQLALQARWPCTPK